MSEMKLEIPRKRVKEYGTPVSIMMIVFVVASGVYTGIEGVIFFSIFIGASLWISYKEFSVVPIEVVVNNSEETLGIRSLAKTEKIDINEIVKIWIDTRHSQKATIHLSSKDRIEFDCTENEHREIAEQLKKINKYIEIFENPYILD